MINAARSAQSGHPEMLSVCSWIGCHVLKEAYLLILPFQLSYFNQCMNGLPYSSRSVLMLSRMPNLLFHGTFRNTSFKPCTVKMISINLLNVFLVMV